MIKGFIMASGLITYRILFGKKSQVKNPSIILGFSMLNLLWITTLIISIVGIKESNAYIISNIISIVYPTLLIFFGIKNKKKRDKIEK